MNDIFTRIKNDLSPEASAKKIAKKFGEEAVELAIAATALHDKGKSAKRREQVKGGAADVMFHYLSLLAKFDIEPAEITAILEERLEKKEEK